MKSAFQFLIILIAVVLCACSASPMPESDSVSETISAETEESIESDNNDTIIKASESAPMSFRKSDTGSISVDSYKKPSSEGFAYELIGVDDKDLHYPDV